MTSYEPQKHQKHPKKRNHHNTSLFSPPTLNSQQNRPHHHLHNTLPRPQKVPQLKRTQNDKKRRKIRVFSTFALSPLLDHQISPNLRRNRTRNNPLYPQKVPQVKRKQNDENRTQTPPLSHFSHFSVSPHSVNEKPQTLRWNRTRSDPLHPKKVPQVKRNEKQGKNHPKHRQLTPYSPTMDPTTSAQIRNLVLELKAISDEKIELYKGMAKILGEMRADLKAKGMTANSSSNIIPTVVHTPSTPTPSPIIPQPSYVSVSTQTAPPVVYQPSYASISIQTEPFTEIVKIATVSTIPQTLPPPPPPPTSSLGLIPTSPPPLLPTLPTIIVSAPISESPSGSTTLSRPQASSERLGTLRPRPYPPSQSRPPPEPPPGHGSMSRVRRGRRTLKRG